MIKRLKKFLNNVIKYLLRPLWVEAFFIGSALAEDSPSDSEVNQQTTGYAGVISIALASRKIPPMLS